MLCTQKEKYCSATLNIIHQFGLLTMYQS